MTISTQVASAGRLVGRVAVVFGAGQTVGETLGNGRAAAIAYAREGARIVAVDRDIDSARTTALMIEAEGGEAVAVEADVTCENDIVTALATASDRWGRIDILHNNVGVGVLAGDAAITEIDASAFSRIMDINLRGMVLACKHALPVMRAQGRGVVINIASNAALIDYPYVAYKTSKAAVISLTEHVAISNAPHGIRANAILPGLMDTPMAVERHLGSGQGRDEIVASRTARVPLGRSGTAWDVAHAAVFLASDEASFITGASLVIDGAQSLVVG